MPLKYSRIFFVDFRNFMDDCFTLDKEYFNDPNKTQRDIKNLKNDVASAFECYLDDDHYTFTKVSKSKDKNNKEFNFQALSRIDYAGINKPIRSEGEDSKNFEARKNAMNEKLSSLTANFSSLFENNSYGIYEAGDTCNNFSATYSRLNAYERQELANKYMEAITNEICTPTVTAQKDAMDKHICNSSVDIAYRNTEDRKQAAKNISYKF